MNLPSQTNAGVFRVGDSPLNTVAEISVSNVGFQGMGDSAVLFDEEVQTESSVDVPWNIIVENDPVNLMSYVTMVFMRVFGYPRPKAQKHMMEVHELGRSMVWSGQRERAEFYVQQLHQSLLLARLEKSS